MVYDINAKQKHLRKKRMIHIFLVHLNPETCPGVGLFWTSVPPNDPTIGTIVDEKSIPIREWRLHARDDYEVILNA